MTNTEQKWLKEIRDNTEQLKRIADKLDVIARLMANENEEAPPSDKPAECLGCKYVEITPWMPPCSSCNNFSRYWDGK